MVSFALLVCMLLASIEHVSTVAFRRGDEWPEDSFLLDVIENSSLILAVGDPILSHDKRQSASAIQTNISDIIIPPATQRWTLSIEARIQMSSPADCTLQICLDSNICGSTRALGDNWVTVTLVARLLANVRQDVDFVASCSNPTRIALRSMVVPGRSIVVTTTAVSTQLMALPPETQTVTVLASTIVSTGDTVLYTSSATSILSPMSRSGPVRDQETEPGPGTVFSSTEATSDTELVTSLSLAGESTTETLSSVTTPYLPEAASSKGESAFVTSSSTSSTSTSDPMLSSSLQSSSVTTFETGSSSAMPSEVEPTSGSPSSSEVESYAETPPSITSIMTSEPTIPSDSQSDSTTAPETVVSTIIASETESASQSVTLPDAISLTETSATSQSYSRTAFDSSTELTTQTDSSVESMPTDSATEIRTESSEELSTLSQTTTLPEDPTGASSFLSSGSGSLLSSTSTDSATEASTESSEESNTVSQTTTASEDATGVSSILSSGEQTAQASTSSTEQSEVLSGTTSLSQDSSDLSSTQLSTQSSSTPVGPGSQSSTGPTGSTITSSETASWSNDDIGTSTTSTLSTQPSSSPISAPEDVYLLNVTATNNCPSGNPAIVGTSRMPDWLLLDQERDASFARFNVSSDDAIANFESLTGRTMCASLPRTGYDQCGIEGIQVPDLIEGDEVQLTCSLNNPKLPTVDDAVLIGFALQPTCGIGVIQIGCEPGRYCLSYYSSKDVFVWDYPLLEPMARLRVKTVGSHRSIEWATYFTFGVSDDAQDYTLSSKVIGEWLYINVPVEAASIRVSADCDSPSNTTQQPSLASSSTSQTTAPSISGPSPPASTSISDDPATALETSSLSPIDPSVTLATTTQPLVPPEPDPIFSSTSAPSISTSSSATDSSVPSPTQTQYSTSSEATSALSSTSSSLTAMDSSISSLEASSTLSSTSTSLSITGSSGTTSPRTQDSTSTESITTLPSTSLPLTSTSSPTTDSSFTSTTQSTEFTTTLSSTLTSPPPSNTSISTPITSTSSTSQSTSTSTSSSPPTAPPAQRVGFPATARNICKTLRLPILVSQPEIRIDAIRFTDSETADAGVWSDNPYPTFQQVTGGQTCITSLQTGQQWCGYDAVAAQVTRSGEVLEVDCPDPRPGPPSLAVKVALGIRIGVAAPSSVACANLVVQIGCEPGSYCLGYAYLGNAGANTNGWTYLQYPQLNPKARLRVKVVAARASWTVSYYDGVDDQRDYVRGQVRGEWLDVTQFLFASANPNGASIVLQATCYGS